MQGAVSQVRVGGDVALLMFLGPRYSDVKSVGGESYQASRRSVSRFVRLSS